MTERTTHDVGRLSKSFPDMDRLKTGLTLARNAGYRPAPHDTLVSVVLPVYNEALALPVLSARVAQTLDDCGVRYEIIFVNDGSRDESAAVLDHLAAVNHCVRVIHLSRNFGHQAAVQAGLSHARGDAVVLMDSDMQDAPEAIGRFLARWRAGYDVVYAERRRRKESRWKTFLFAAFHRLMSRMASVPIPVDAGNFGLIDARVARQIVALRETDRYFPGLRSWVGFRQTGVEVERNARYDRHPRVSLRGLFRLAKTAMFSFSTLPLMVFHVIGAMAAVIFMYLSCFSLYCKLFTDQAIPGWTSYMLTGSFFGALNALGIAILGEYVTRIYDQVRARPTYLVDRTVNVGDCPDFRVSENGTVPLGRGQRDCSTTACSTGVSPAWAAGTAVPQDESNLPYEDLLAEAEYLLEAGAAARQTVSLAVIPRESPEPAVLPLLEE